MANATETEVLEILDADTAMTVTTITPFLTAAYRIVTDRLGSFSVDADTLVEVERWLAAHLIAMSDRETGLAAERVGEAAVTYAGKFGLGLDGTRYGQMAKALDPTGQLAVTGMKRARFDVLDIIDGGS